MPVAFITHPDYAAHVTGADHPESPERLRAVLDAVGHSGLEEHLDHIAPDPVDDHLLAAVHSSRYIARVKTLSQRGGGMLDPDTVVSPASYEVARLAAGGAVSAVHAVLDRRVPAAFAAVRPPGHHALPARGMGFCLFNNVACAAVAARQQQGSARTAILDWDVHHGNGTQAIFYRDPSVLFVSLHQEDWYPGSGAIEETGEADGVGFTVNIPLPAGTGDEGYRSVFEDVVLPLLQAAAPELLLVSAGYDAHFDDPLGGMRLTAAGFFALTVALRAVYEGPLVAVLEGGYQRTYLGNSVVATLAALVDAKRTAPQEPTPVAETSFATIRSRVRAVRSVVRNYWNI